MIKVGINGFGRIGKCVLLQLINNPLFSIVCLNASKMDINEIEDYLTYDSVHKHNIPIKIEIKTNNLFCLNGKHDISLIKERDAKKIDWVSLGCEYLIDCTGAYLTMDKCKDHNAPFVVISSPAKDKMPTFIHGVNEHLYKDEPCVSGSSCTTNGISPILRILDDAFKIKDSVFTTIHAATASQYVVDVLQKSVRTDRSVFNNIIPHTTGASSSVTSVLPQLKGKIFGTSVRVPVANCSLIDLNITLENEEVKLSDIEKLIRESKYFGKVYEVTNKKLVSGDFCTTTTPSILDIGGCIEMGKGKFKLFIWYDNEWSYSAQLIRLVETMYNKNKYFVGNMSLEGKGVVCRFDYNVPKNKEGEVTDDFRVASTIPTIELILKKNPKYMVLACHFGRPKGKDENLSTKFLIPILEKYLQKEIKFLPEGISEESIKEISSGIYLLENLRFHKEETSYEKDSDCSLTQIYKDFGDVFICDAFGCAHRKHLSIYAPSTFNKMFGYGLLIKKEVEAINAILNTENKRVLGVIGGNKIADKMPIIQSLKKIKKSVVFVAGGLAKQYIVNGDNEIVMMDGFGAFDLNENPEYIEDIKNTDRNVYDIGSKSLQILNDLVALSDVIFWNGSLGLIEKPEYRIGSEKLIDVLLGETCEGKTIIMGGGETASLIKDKSQNRIYVSTGGGALLEYLENKLINNKTLVGLEIYNL